MSINQLGKVLKSAGFESEKRHKEWRFTAIELSHDPVEARRKGFWCDPVDDSEESDNDVDSGVKVPKSKLPFCKWGAAGGGKKAVLETFVYVVPRSLYEELVEVTRNNIYRSFEKRCFASPRCPPRSIYEDRYGSVSKLRFVKADLIRYLILNIERQCSMRSRVKPGMTG